MADSPELKTQKLVSNFNKKFGLNETTLRGILDNASAGSVGPNGTLEITENGTYDVANYAAVNVNVANNGGGIFAKIITAELSGVTMELYDSSSNLLQSEIGGKNIVFNVQGEGNYIVKAIKDGIELWTNSVYVWGCGNYYCKSGKVLNDYEWSEIAEASALNISNYMWSVGDGKTLISDGSIFNNYEFIIIGFNHDVLAIDGISKAGITFMMKQYYAGSKYDINTKIYVNGSSVYRNAGGYRSSTMRQRSSLKGEEVYSQASSVTSELLASGFIYEDDTICPIYSYDGSTDTYADASGETFNKTTVYHIKGYYKSVGTISSSEFVKNKHFIYSSSSSSAGYTVPTSWTSGKEYYVICKTMQENGVFCEALSEIMPYIKPVKKTQSTGNQEKYLCTTIERVWHLAVEEVFGINNNTILFNGEDGTSANAYNPAGEGSIYDYFKNNYSLIKTALGETVWTRSPNINTSNANKWNNVYSTGYINSNYTHTTNFIRICFCI